MGKIIKSEKSTGDLFQFTLWENEKGFLIEIKKYFKTKEGGIQYKNWDRLRLLPEEFEQFKRWINTFEKKT